MIRPKAPLNSPITLHLVDGSIVDCSARVYVGVYDIYHKHGMMTNANCDIFGVISKYSGDDFIIIRSACLTKTYYVLIRSIVSIQDNRRED